MKFTFRQVKPSTLYMINFLMLLISQLVNVFLGLKITQKLFCLMVSNYCALNI